MNDTPDTGTVAWVDLTVPEAQEVRDFYEAVVGWGSQAVSMGEYSDYAMVPHGSDAPVAGICHARGVNAHLPPVWMVYILVADLAASIQACKEQGGEVLQEPKTMGPEDAYAVIRDPAGAVAALYQKGPPKE